MFFTKWRQNRREARRLAYFRLGVLADVDHLMGFPGDEQFIPRLCQKYPTTATIIEEEFRSDASVQLAGRGDPGSDGEDTSDGARRRQMTQKTVAVNLVSGIMSTELSKLSDEARRGVAQELTTMISEHPFTSVLSLTDVGGGHVVQLAGETIRRLRKNSETEKHNAVGNKVLPAPEVAWLLLDRRSPEAVIAAILISAAFVAHRWALGNLVNPEASEHKHLRELLTIISDAK